MNNVSDKRDARSVYHLGSRKLLRQAWKLQSTTQPRSVACVSKISRRNKSKEINQGVSPIKSLQFMSKFSISVELLVAVVIFVVMTTVDDVMVLAVVAMLI